MTIHDYLLVEQWETLIQSAESNLSLSEFMPPFKPPSKMEKTTKKETNEKKHHHQKTCTWTIFIILVISFNTLSEYVV